MKGDGHSSYFKCFRMPEGVGNKICAYCLLAKSPDYFMRIREGAHISWVSVFSKLKVKICLIPVFAVLLQGPVSN